MTSCAMPDLFLTLSSNTVLMVDTPRLASSTAVLTVLMLFPSWLLVISETRVLQFSTFQTMHNKAQ